MPPFNQRGARMDGMIRPMRPQMQQRPMGPSPQMMQQQSPAMQGGMKPLKAGPQGAMPMQQIDMSQLQPKPMPPIGPSPGMQMGAVQDAGMAQGFGGFNQPRPDAGMKPRPMMGGGLGPSRRMMMGM